MTKKLGLDLVQLQQKNEAQASQILNLIAENTQLKEQILLHNSGPSLRNILAVMPGNVFWMGRDGRYLGCNNNIVKICNMSSPEDIIGKTLADLYNPDIASSVQALDEQIMQSGERCIAEEIGLNSNNEPAYFLSEKIPLCNQQGNIVGLLGVSFDITERKQMEIDLKIAKEKAEASDRAKSQFLAVINHELRTPLASITGLINFLKRKSLTKAEEEKLIHGIDSCAKHLLSLIDDVLDFSRLDADQYHLKLTAINLDNLWHEVFTILNPLAESKGLLLSFDNPSPINIITDARILRQILINLITNAIKFTETGYVKVKIITSNEYETIVPLKIVIEDSGIGIPADKLDVIFEPFQQLEDAYTRQSSRSGTGLGLAIVKKLASLIDATISAESEINHGSKFTLSSEFKIAKISEDTFTKPSLMVEKTKLTAKMLYPHHLNYQPHILLIEDDPIVQYIHEKLLLDLGCKVDVITHGLEAIKKLDKHHLVLVDISLPDISGFEVIKTMRKQHANQQLPIIALTVYNGKTEKMACLNAGANAFKNKPISPGGLKKLLLKYLSQQLD